MDITHDNVCSSMLSCFYSHLLSTGRPISSLHLNNYLVIFLHNTIYRAQLFYPFLLSASEFLSNLLFSYHLLYFCTALFLIIILSSNHLHKSKTLSQLTQCPFMGTLLLFHDISNLTLPNLSLAICLKVRKLFRA